MSSGVTDLLGHLDPTLLTECQRKLRTMFVDCVKGVPERNGHVEERYDSIHRALTLQLIPSTGKRADIEVIVSDTSCDVGIGGYSVTDYYGFCDDKYIDDLRELIDAAVHGRMRQETARWRGMEICWDTVFDLEAGPYRYSIGGNIVALVASLLLKGKEVEVTQYQSYVD